MKYKCEMIRDLLPLYIDEVCSDESRKIVEDHIKECPECASLTDSMRNDEAVNGAEDYESAQVRSLRNVRKKQKKNLCILITAGIIIGLLPFVITLMVFGVFGVVIYDAAIKKPSVCTDISKYSYCLDKEKDGQYFLNESNRRIFPEKIKNEMTVTDFQYVNYNPWDPQIITYLTVKYSDEDYKTELKRLSDIGNEKYEGIYSVTGDPEGYDLIAMDADEYYGFVYALKPENEDNTVTYSAVMFCNYFLDVDIDDYMPEKYQLEGFDAGENNPYRKKMMSAAH